MELRWSMLCTVEVLWCSHKHKQRAVPCQTEYWRGNSFVPFKDVLLFFVFFIGPLKANYNTCSCRVKSCQTLILTVLPWLDTIRDHCNLISALTKYRIICRVERGNWCWIFSKILERVSEQLWIYSQSCCGPPEWLKDIEQSTKNIDLLHNSIQSLLLKVIF